MHFSNSLAFIGYVKSCNLFINGLFALFELILIETLTELIAGVFEARELQPIKQHFRAIPYCVLPQKFALKCCINCCVKVSS